VYKSLASAYEGALAIEDLHGLLGEGAPGQVQADGVPEKGWASGSDDDRAADHQALLGLNVLPYASVFLESDVMLGGLISQRVSQYRIETGLDAGGTLPPDHISSELELVGRMVAVGDESIWTFMDTHLLAWLPAFVHAVRKENVPPYSRLVGFTLDFVLDHRRLSSKGASDHLERPASVPAVLENETSGIAEIARFLTTPIWCGFYLSRAGIGRLGRGPRLPHGFGSRAQMMATLLRSAVDFEGLDALAEGLNGEIAEARLAWETFGGEDIEAAEFWANEWIQRLDQTRALLDEMLRAVHRISSASHPSP
jgi:hypothetical protein